MKRLSTGHLVELSFNFLIVQVFKTKKCVVLHEVSVAMEPFLENLGWPMAKQSFLHSQNILGCRVDYAPVGIAMWLVLHCGRVDLFEGCHMQ